MKRRSDRQLLKRIKTAQAAEEEYDRAEAAKEAAQAEERNKNFHEAQRRWVNLQQTWTELHPSLTILDQAKLLQLATLYQQYRQITYLAMSLTKEVDLSENPEFISVSICDNGETCRIYNDGTVMRAWDPVFAFVNRRPERFSLLLHPTQWLPSDDALRVQKKWK